MEEQIKQLQKQVVELQNRLNGISNDTRQVEVIRNSVFETAAKSADSETVTINESGSSTRTVLDNPDGFVRTRVGSKTIYLPYFL